MRRKRRFVLAVLLAALTVGLPAAPRRVPGGTVPADLRDAWLRFHEADLCQGLNAVFDLRPDRLEIWCVVEDERSYEKLRDLLVGLRKDYRIELYPTRPPAEKKTADDRDPPPSVWNNDELRSYLHDPFARRDRNTPPGLETRPGLRQSEADFLLKQRMILFAEQTLDYDRRMNRYASELPELARLAVDPTAGPEAKSRAVSVCVEHAQAADKLAARLSDNLTEALPKASKRGKTAAGLENEDRPGLGAVPSTLSPAVDSAVRLAASAEGVAERVYQFIHPQLHTVRVTDLREPSLLESIRDLRRTIADFLRTIGSKS